MTEAPPGFESVLVAYCQVRPNANQQATLFCSCDLDLDPMTLRYELDLNILKM